MITERNEYAKQIRKESAQAQYLLILLYLSNYNISRLRNRFDEQDLKNVENEFRIKNYCEF